MQNHAALFAFLFFGGPIGYGTESKQEANTVGDDLFFDFCRVLSCCGKTLEGELGQQALVALADIQCCGYYVVTFSKSAR